MDVLGLLSELAEFGPTEEKIDAAMGDSTAGAIFASANKIGETLQVQNPAPFGAAA